MNFYDEEFEEFCKKARILNLLILWITDNIAVRQRAGHPGLDAIEENFKEFGKGYQQNVDFRLDRGDHLIVFPQYLIVGGYESICRHSKEESIIENVIQNLSIQIVEIGKIDPIRKGDDVNVWTYVYHLRNSLSHFRYEYDPSGRVKFEDFRPGSPPSKTAEFSMTLVDLLDFSYRFTHICLQIWEKMNQNH